MRPAPTGAPEEQSGVSPGRGVLLLAVALGIGIVVLNAADDSPASRISTRDRGTTTTELVSTTTTAPLRLPREVKVIAANGTRTKGAAAKVTDKLRLAGYNVLSPTDASRADASIVYFGVGYEREAQSLAQVLGIPLPSVLSMPTPPPITDARDANVIVLVGPDLAGPSPTTTTTRRTTSSTGSTTSTTRSTTTTRPTTTTSRPTTTTTRAATTSSTTTTTR